MFRVQIRTGQKYVFYLHNNHVLFEIFAGVPNHCASDKAILPIQVSRTICIIIIIMSSAWYDDRPWPRLMSNYFCLTSGIYRLLANISFKKYFKVIF